MEQNNNPHCGFLFWSKSLYNTLMTNLSSNLQTILENRLRYLPEITGQAINSIDWATRIITIGHKYGLHVDEMEEFQEVVLKSMTGLIAPEQFESELITALALSPATTEKIIAELNAQIFEPVHDYVMHGGKSDGLKTSGIEVEKFEDYF
jgi:hypothetical protein